MDKLRAGSNHAPAGTEYTIKMLGGSVTNEVFKVLLYNLKTWQNV